MSTTELPRRRFLKLAAVAGATVVGVGTAAGGCYALVETGVLPGRETVARRLGRCGTMPALPDNTPGEVREQRYGPSRAIIGLPPGVTDLDGLPIVLTFHGAAGDARTPFDRYGLQHYWPAGARFAVVSMDDWEPDQLGSRLLPFLKALGVQTARFGLLGWSRGGRGVLDYAANAGSGRVVALATTSAAVGAGDVAGLAGKLKGIPAHITCGRDDSYAAANEALRRALGAEGGLTQGCHDTVIRRKMLSAQLKFFAENLPG